MLDLASPSRTPLLADLCALAGLAIAGGLSCDALHTFVTPDDVSLLPKGGRVVLRGSVADVRRSASGRTRVVAASRTASRIGSRDALKVTGAVWVSWPDGAPRPRRRDLVEVIGTLHRPTGRRNPDCFDFREYLGARGVHAVLYSEWATVVARGRGPSALAAWIERTIDRHLDGDAAALLRALLLGRTGSMPQELLASFRRSGTVHVLAVSGLHVGFVVLIIYALLRSARVRPIPARLLILPFLVGFIALIGPRPSVVRAATMAAAFILSWALQRKAHTMNAAGLAALVLMVGRPGAVFDLGFQLSFTATLGIIVLFRPLRAGLGRLARWPGPISGRLADALAVSIAAQLGVAPVLTAKMGGVSLVAPLANLAVVPLAAFSVASGIAMLLAEAIAPVASSAFAASTWASLTSLAAVTRFAGSHSCATLALACRYWPAVIFVDAAIVCFLRWRSRRGRRAGWTASIMAAVTVTALTLLGPGRSRPRVVFFDVGQGDAVLLEAPGGVRVLVDTGPGGCGRRRPDAGRDVLVPYFRANGVSGLRAVVITHAHADHYGGARAVLENVTTEQLLAPASCLTDTALAGVVAAARAAGAEILAVGRGDTILSAPSLAIAALAPADGWSGRAVSENDMSVVASAQVGRLRLLLTGDIERPTESFLLTEGDDLSADVLKVAHHGSSTSSTPAFLDSCGPRAAVISVGRSNRYGHPGDDVLERLSTRGVRTFRTDLDGAVIVDVTRGRALMRGLASRRTAVVRTDDTRGRGTVRR